MGNDHTLRMEATVLSFYSFIQEGKAIVKRTKRVTLGIDIKFINMVRKEKDSKEFNH